MRVDFTKTDQMLSIYVEMFPLVSESQMTRHGYKKGCGYFKLRSVGITSAKDGESPPDVCGS